MSEQVVDIDRLIDEAERIGVVGSPSSTSELALDVLASAVDKKLVGEFGLFRFRQDGKNHYALGQITEVKLTPFVESDPDKRFSLDVNTGKIDEKLLYLSSAGLVSFYGELTLDEVVMRCYN